MNIDSIKITEKYEDRAVEFDGIWEDNGWRFKIYKLTHKKNSPADEETLLIAKNFSKNVILDFTTKNGTGAPSYGLGYIILHRGMDSNFIAVNWWSGENMLVTRTMLAPLDDPHNYNEITETGMNICVWDMLIHYFERNTWVENILKNHASPKAEEYMKAVYKS